MGAGLGRGKLQDSPANLEREGRTRQKRKLAREEVSLPSVRRADA